jgi:hypothetical protein
MELIFAYIDPGSGSLIVQALIAGLVAIPIFFRHQITRLVRSVRGKDDASVDASTGQDDSTTSA